jgi:hypothetical protein
MRPRIWEDIPTFPSYQATRDRRIRRGKNELKQFNRAGTPHVKLWKVLGAGNQPWRQLFIVAVDVLVSWTFRDKCVVCIDSTCILCQRRRKEYVWRTLPGVLFSDPIPTRRRNKRERVQPYG